MSSKVGLGQHFPKQVSHEHAGGIGGTGQAGTASHSGDRVLLLPVQNKNNSYCAVRAAQAQAQGCDL